MPKIRLISKEPCTCSDVEISDFVAFARAGGEVAGESLEQRVHEAKTLVFLRRGDCLLGIAALKHPTTAYQSSVSSKTAVKLPRLTYPFEVGYVFILPSSRGAHLSRPLVAEALQASHGSGVFATSRIDNVAMHATLSHFGFKPTGRDYASRRGDYSLRLFVRAPAAEGGTTHQS